MNSTYELTACYDLEYVKHPSVFQLSEETARLLKHGYCASVSYVDACFGKLMQGLKAMGLDQNTIVVMWGDHGWKLGEHGSWCKQTNYDNDTRVPLMVRVPGGRGNGNRFDQLVELIDLYPSLCHLAGIKIPKHMEGVSFGPLLDDPNRSWKSAVFSQYHQRPKVTPDHNRYMGYSMVTEQYHYVEWYFWDNQKKKRLGYAGRELYDLKRDPAENLNISENPEMKTAVDRLSKQLQAGWKAALPK